MKTSPNVHPQDGFSSSLIPSSHPETTRQTVSDRVTYHQHIDQPGAGVIRNVDDPCPEEGSPNQTSSCRPLEKRVKSGLYMGSHGGNRRQNQDRNRSEDTETRHGPLSWKGIVTRKPWDKSGSETVGGGASRRRSVQRRPYRW